MNATSRIPLFAAAIAFALTAGCSDSQEPPKPGVATVSLVTPNADDGAISLTITGPGISDVQPASSTYLAYSRGVSSSEARVIVLGDLSPGVLATVEVADVNHLDQYSAQVLEVASRADAARASTSGYRITLAASH